MNTVRSLNDGHPRDASTNDHKVGKSKSSVPVWFQSRIRLAKASNFDWEGGSLTESVEGESDIKISEKKIFLHQGKMIKGLWRGLEVG